jgi:cytoskeletal protein RodZ
MTSVGNTLRKERERQQRAVSEIAEDLCITQRYLLALEEDDLKSLPGTFFYKSFVRQYAALLGLDPAKLQSAIEHVTGEDQPPPPEPTRDPIVSEANRRLFADRRIAVPVIGLVVAVLGCSGVYSWWTKARQYAAANPVAKVTGSAPVKLPAPDAAAVKPQIVPAAATVEETPDGVNKVVVNVSATEKTWVSIVADGRTIFSGVLEPTQTKTLKSTDSAWLKVGNAGGVEVKLNGKPLPPIGTRGQVREVVLTPDSYQVLPPKQSTL